MRPTLLLGLLAASCGSRDVPLVPDPMASVQRLSDSDRLMRISMAVRGVRPSLDDFARFEADPNALEALVDEWLADPRFGETIKDMYAEAMLIRADTEPVLLSQGPLTEVTSDRIFDAVSESALRLIEHVVVEDLPFTEIVTADYTFGNAVSRDLYGLPYTEGGPEWQQTTWGDGRPMAGILSDSGLWMRYPSNGSNFHRGRANFVASTLLCDDFNKREISVDGGIDLSDEEAVANAVTSIPNCIGCHQALEPMAAFFWGFRQDTLRTASYRAYIRFDCQGEAADYCYPLNFYRPEFEDDWEAFGLQPPAYFGEPGETLVDLGQFVAEDPRFAECAARRFHAYLTQGEVLDTPVEVISPLQQRFVDNGFNARDLVKAIVLSDTFAVASEFGPAGSAGLQTIRPEQFSRTMEDLTGFQMWASLGCSFEGCFSNVPLVTTDRFGFRSMAGGVDGLQVTRPTHSPTPTKLMFMQYYATEAAGFVVQGAERVDPADRKLLIVPGALEGQDEAVRDQIVYLHARILGEFLDREDPEIDRTKSLYDSSIARGGTPADAWEQVLTALLQDIRVLFY